MPEPKKRAPGDLVPLSELTEEDLRAHNPALYASIQEAARARAASAYEPSWSSGLNAEDRKAFESLSVAAQADLYIRASASGMDSIRDFLESRVGGAVLAGPQVDAVVAAREKWQTVAKYMVGLMSESKFVADELELAGVEVSAENLERACAAPPPGTRFISTMALLGFAMPALRDFDGLGASWKGQITEAAFVEASLGAAGHAVPMSRIERACKRVRELMALEQD